MKDILIFSLMKILKNYESVESGYRGIGRITPLFYFYNEIWISPI